MDKLFFGLDEIQELGLPSARTLRNALDARSGKIHIGGDVPDLHSILVGGSRVITRGEINRWVREVEAIAGGTSPQPVSEKPRRRRGRPRKSEVVQRGGQ